MNPATLKKHILKVIPNLIGKYTYPNGYRSNAIAVGNIPNNVKVSGVEVILPNFPTVLSSNQHGYTQHRRENWKVTLVNHGQDKDLWFKAIDSLMLYFPDCSGVDVPQSDPNSSLPMYVITIHYSDGYDRLTSSPT